MQRHWNVQAPLPSSAALIVSSVRPLMADLNFYNQLFRYYFRATGRQVRIFRWVPIAPGAAGAPGHYEYDGVTLLLDVSQFSSILNGLHQAGVYRNLALNRVNACQDVVRRWAGGATFRFTPPTPPGPGPAQIINAANAANLFTPALPDWLTLEYILGEIRNDLIHNIDLGQGGLVGQVGGDGQPVVPVNAPRQRIYGCYVGDIRYHLFELLRETFGLNGVGNIFNVSRAQW